MKPYDVSTNVGAFVRKVIKNISIIAVFICMLVIGIAAFGAELNIDLASKQFQATSILIIMLSMLLYTTWMGNGKSDGISAKEFTDTFKAYKNAVNCLVSATMRQYLTYEAKERKRAKERELADYLGISVDELYTISTAELKQRRIKFLLRRRIKRLQRGKLPKLAFATVEQIKGLQGFAGSGKIGEASRFSETVYMSFSFVSKAIMTILFVFVGVSIGIKVGNSNILEALLTIIIAVISLTFAVVGGYNMGYTRIMTYRKNILLTATNYITACGEFAKEKGLPFKGAADPNIVDVIEEAVYERVRKNVTIEYTEEINEEKQG